MTADRATGAPPSPPASWPITERPGFLIRRLHQIHVALFSEHCARFDVTPVQYSVLSALQARGRADQTTLASDVLLDRTTTTGALTRLERRGLVERVTPVRDRRARECRLTPLGTDTLAAMEAAARRAHGDTVSALGASDRRRLLELMRRLVAAHGGRALDPPA